MCKHEQTHLQATPPPHYYTVKVRAGLLLSEQTDMEQSRLQKGSERRNRLLVLGHRYFQGGRAFCDLCFSLDPKVYWKDSWTSLLQIGSLAA